MEDRATIRNGVSKRSSRRVPRMAGDPNQEPKAQSQAPNQEPKAQRMQSQAPNQATLTATGLRLGEQWSRVNRSATSFIRRGRANTGIIAGSITSIVWSSSKTATPALPPITLPRIATFRQPKGAAIVD